MGVFLFSTYELDSTGTSNQDKVFRKILDYIIHNLNDVDWQESVSNKTKKDTTSQRIIKIYLRFFNKKRIEESGLNSYAKYSNKKECLIIDPIFSIEEYANLEEHEMRKKISNHIFYYLQRVITKYKDRFKDFDATLFVGLLNDRFEDIKSDSLPYSGSNELDELLKGLID